ncbi:hypothetical protein ACMYR3_02220 [Ampullimonas aquatilis]|uniref:hypothetical protein n=1 Tax=Ampullimonas aquatilis TaxID=1341549 RepID=UPI003C73D29A
MMNLSTNDEIEENIEDQKRLPPRHQGLKTVLEIRRFGYVVWGQSNTLSPCLNNAAQTRLSWCLGGKRY